MEEKEEYPIISKDQFKYEIRPEIDSNPIISQDKFVPFDGEWVDEMRGVDQLPIGDFPKVMRTLSTPTTHTEGFREPFPARGIVIIGAHGVGRTTMINSLRERREDIIIVDDIDEGLHTKERVEKMMLGRRLLSDTFKDEKVFELTNPYHNLEPITVPKVKRNSNFTPKKKKRKKR